jgi:phage tail-like protein
MLQLFHRSKVLPSFYYQVNTPFGKEGFSEVSGLSMTMETTPQAFGGLQKSEYHLPKSIRFENLKLKRPLISGSSLAEWCRKTILGGFELIVPMPMTIMLLNPETDAPTAIWLVEKAYPVKYNVPTLNANENQLAYEEMEFAYQKFDRQF